MIPKARNLAGKTIFITGASRGIGKAIATRCAKDGANIVIAAKTAKPHPKLPDTIFTAAKEVELAGGKCLPCEVDIRDEEQVKRAVEKAVERFGGIDILINNASAISLTNTQLTPMKKFDLMFSVNTRGTFMCSKYCIPHLLKSKEPHILNISPPLIIKTHWFKDYTAYTIAKYGMSMCVLGMAGEFKEAGVKVNALWPRTAVNTAATEMLGGGSDVKNWCRKPEIMSDAAHVILTNPSPSNTGNYYIDEEVLREAGVNDFNQYNYIEDPNLMLDAFIEENDPDNHKNVFSMNLENAKERENGEGGEGSLEKTVEGLKTSINEDLISKIQASYLFEFNDKESILLDLTTPPGKIGIISEEEKETLCPDSVFKLTPDLFQNLVKGKEKAASAYFTGKLKISGDFNKALKLEKVFQTFKSKL